MTAAGLVVLIAAASMGGGRRRRRPAGQSLEQTASDPSVSLMSFQLQDFYSRTSTTRRDRLHRPELQAALGVFNQDLLSFEPRVLPFGTRDTRDPPRAT
jgi:hypothetical protein